MIKLTDYTGEQLGGGTAQAVDNRRELSILEYIILVWLDSYEQCLDAVNSTRGYFHGIATNASSPHQKLIFEATMMELDLQRDWLKLARRSLEPGLREGAR